MAKSGAPRLPLRLILRFAFCYAFPVGNGGFPFIIPFPKGRLFWVCKQKSADFSADFYIINII